MTLTFLFDMSAYAASVCEIVVVNAAFGISVLGSASCQQG